ncbi:outer membrane protein, adhesin transport system [Modicisalibacter muralis]|uniref:Outer membrane protein, adhesin transport system n=1 Tax=Modicisalibacter muralis TaxID=119000 RepID=A0A1G9FAW1_9GAMM|nr:TolC family outer membrane protein [Halomonas muralis]SDK85475.1 outer membrane protein, adhesin transport system [Halomonas muralis]
MQLPFSARTSILTAVLAAPLTTGVALAQDTAAVDTLREAVSRAVTNNPSVQASWHGFQASRHDVDVAFGGYLPSIDVTAGVGRESREDDGRGSYDSDFAEITLTQMLWDGLAIANEVERLNHAKLVSYYEVMGTSNDVALEVTQAYQDVKRYRELVLLARDNYAKHLTVYRQIEQRVESGAGRRVNLEQISGRLALAESNLLTEAANLHDVSARYLRLVGVLPAEELTPVPQLDTRLPASVDEAVNLAYEGNPGFHAAIENINAARAEADGTKSAFHPQLEFRASTGTNNESGIQGRYDQTTVELVASMNLYRGGSDLASFRGASDRVSQAIDQREQECVSLRQTTMIAYNDTRRIAEQLEYLNQHRLSIGRVRGAYQQQFDIGERSLLDVLDSENEYFEASRAYVNAQYDLELAYARTLAAMGQLLPALEVSRQGVPTLAELGSNGVTIDGETICPAPAPTHYTLDELTAGLLPASLSEPTQANR